MWYKHGMACNTMYLQSHHGLQWHVLQVLACMCLHVCACLHVLPAGPATLSKGRASLRGLPLVPVLGRLAEALSWESK